MYNVIYWAMFKNIRAAELVQMHVYKIFTPSKAIKNPNVINTYQVNDNVFEEQLF